MLIIDNEYIGDKADSPLADYQPKCEFVLYVSNKKLVKRKAFEQYRSKSLEMQGRIQVENAI